MLKRVHALVLLGLLAWPTCGIAAESAADAEAKAAYDRKDYAAAAKRWRSLAEQGDADAQWRLGLLYRAGEGVEKNATQAVHWLEKAAAAGELRAALSLSRMYKAGETGAVDLEQRAVWLRYAAERGDTTGQYLLGAAYKDGTGVPKDPARALEWFRRGAEKGAASCEIGLGYLYYEGTGVAKDHAEAARWFLRAAEHGDSFAQESIGRMYRDGDGVPRNNTEAARWLGLAADKGEKDAQLLLGVDYYLGGVVEKNWVQAVHYLTPRAEGGDARAQVMLGDIHFRGDATVPKDQALGASWIRKAAMQNEPTAQFTLAALYFAGTGVAKDLDEAVAWATKGEQSGHEGATCLLDVIDPARTGRSQFDNLSLTEAVSATIAARSERCGKWGIKGRFKLDVHGPAATPEPAR